MTLHKILHFPNPKLRLKAHPVERVDAAVKKLITDMLETMYEDNGIGLAAIQIGIQQQIAVIDISEEKKHPMVLINPVIIEKGGKKKCQEGCLSVPGIYEDVERAEFVKAKAVDRNGNEFEVEADGLLAACIQHELDHLDGILFIDHLSSLKRKLIKNRLGKQQRRNL